MYEYKKYLGGDDRSCELSGKDILPGARYSFTLTAYQQFGSSLAEFEITADETISKHSSAKVAFVLGDPFHKEILF